MNKKIKKTIISFLAVIAAIGLVPLFAAFEAHVINVTAHIENALAVSPEAIDFGTVFPEEVFEKNFRIALSDSFLAEDRVDDVHYKLVQKPKPKGDTYETIYPVNFPDGIVAWDFCLNQQEDPEYLDYCYLNLCPFLEKTSGPSTDPDDTEGSAWLSKIAGDFADTWTLLFDVPCLEGYTPQGEECETIPEEGDFGCDIWVEVTGISEVVK